MTEHVIDLPWSKPPLNMNDRRNRWEHARVVKSVRAAGAWLSRGAGLGSYERVRIQLHYRPATRRGRDNENLVATQKPLIDGLRDASVIRDDTDEFVERVMPEIHAPIKGEPGRMWLVVEILDGPADPTDPTPTPFVAPRRH